MSNNTQLTGAFDLFAKSKDLVMKNLSIFGLLYLIPLLVTLGDTSSRKGVDDKTVEGWGAKLESLSSAGAIGLLGFGIGILILTVVIGLIVQALTFVAELQVSEGKQPTLGDLWNVAKHYWLRLLGLGIVVGLLFVGGLILFIVPGLIVLRRYFLAPYYMLDKDLSISEAMAQSARDTKPVSGSIWGIIGVFVLLSLPGIIPVVGGILSLVLTALYSVAPALRYREIQQLQPAND